MSTPAPFKKGKIYSLESLTADPLATRNTVTFAAACAVGIPPEIALCGEYVEKVGDKLTSVTVWRTRDRSLCGRFEAEKVIEAFKDRDFIANNPEHPVAYIKAAFEAYFRALEFVKDQGPIAIRRRGKKIALISKHTDPDRRTRILDELNKD